jgi:hypothetical protein
MTNHVHILATPHKSDSVSRMGYTWRLAGAVRAGKRSDPFSSFLFCRVFGCPPSLVRAKTA